MLCRRSRHGNHATLQSSRPARRRRNHSHGATSRLCLTNHRNAARPASPRLQPGWLARAHYCTRGVHTDPKARGAGPRSSAVATCLRAGAAGRSASAASPAPYPSPAAPAARPAWPAPRAVAPLAPRPTRNAALHRLCRHQLPLDALLDELPVAQRQVRAGQVIAGVEAHGCTGQAVSEPPSALHPGPEPGRRDDRWQ